MQPFSNQPVPPSLRWLTSTFRNPEAVLIRNLVFGLLPFVAGQRA